MTDFITPDFQPAIAEIFLLTMACVVLLVDVYLPASKRGITYVLAQLSLLVGAYLTLSLPMNETVLTFNGSYINDPMALVLKLFIYLVSFLAFLYARQYLVDRGIYRGEFYVLGLFAVLGMLVMVSAHNYLIIYLGLELLSLSLYAMVAFNRDSSLSAEAAMKYFVLGAIASGMLLYGMSMIYGATGTLDISEIAAFIASSDSDSIVLKFGVAFLVVGIAFKLGAVPFHMWIPDVYQGAPTAVTLFIGSAPKIAAFAMIMRLLVDSAEGLHVHWQDMLIVLSVLSVIVGNVVAIAQTNIKRMLGYSTIAHVGFLLLGILSGTDEGYSASMFYAIVYAITTAAGFGLVILLSRAGYDAEDISDFKGLNSRSPWFAFMVMIVMMSMAGVPPFVGFWAKLQVLQAVVNIELVWLAVLAVLLSVVGAFYYLRIIKFTYFDDADDNAAEIEAPTDMKIALSFNGLLILALGIYPSSLMALCVASIAA
ncbi:NADH-quinone oxidoreductase subunit NuoN [Gammaproteobacteria bacterium AH-315-C21]|nr:NADH-quinone oxidoreductase subunit NuoN [Gammaproteobacteria bacterium AH-315-C21]